jgi:hypothetical protein
MTALANELSKHSIECRTDLWDTVPGTALPSQLTRSLRRCEMLVVRKSGRLRLREHRGRDRGVSASLPHAARGRPTSNHRRRLRTRSRIGCLVPARARPSDLPRARRGAALDRPPVAGDRPANQELGHLPEALLPASPGVLVDVVRARAPDRWRHRAAPPGGNKVVGSRGRSTGRRRASEVRRARLPMRPPAATQPSGAARRGSQSPPRVLKPKNRRCWRRLAATREVEKRVRVRASPSRIGSGCPAARALWKIGRPLGADQVLRGALDLTRCVFARCQAGTASS